MRDLLIDAETLIDALPDSSGWLVFDVRHSLADPGAGHDQYLAGHIPGALFLNQDTDLASACTGTNGRHPLPDRRILMETLHQMGLTRTSKVVVYDGGNSAFAARAWWLFRWLGHMQVAILDGGWDAWRLAGGAQQIGSHNASPDADRTASAVTRGQPGDASMPTIDAAAILADANTRTYSLIDARDAARYRGEKEPIDPVAGHIDGALNRPIASNLQPDGRFKPAGQLHAEFSALLGPDDPSKVIHYCGSGITACHNLFAMELAGLQGSALYPGSWSEWCSDPARPVARS